MSTTEHLDPAVNRLLALFAAVAAENSMKQDDAHALFVNEFCDDLKKQVDQYLDVTLKLAKDVMLVSPTHGTELVDVFEKAIPAVTRLCAYLNNLEQRPLEWPANR